MVQISHTFAGLMNNLSLPSIYDEDIVDLKRALLGNSNIQQLQDCLMKLLTSS